MFPKEDWYGAANVSRFPGASSFHQLQLSLAMKRPGSMAVDVDEAAMPWAIAQRADQSINFGPASLERRPFADKLRR